MLEHSVLIHTFNHAPFVTDCVDSVLRQTQPPDEIIVYDSGSTDGTLALLRLYEDRIRLLTGDHRAEPVHLREAHALHAAFAASRGRTIFLLDGDDRFKPDKIERYIAAFEAHPDASLVQAPVERIDERSRSLGVLFEPRNHVTNHLREIYRRHDLNFFYPASALAFSRYYLERILPLDLSDGLPLWTCTRVCVLAAYYGRIVPLLDPLTDWRCHTKTDTARLRPGSLQIRQYFMRAQVFNAFCRHHKLRTISPWRSRRLYGHVLRYAMPSRLFDFCNRRLRPLFEWLD